MAWQAALTNFEQKKSDKEPVHKLAGAAVDAILRSSAVRRTCDNITSVLIAFDGFVERAAELVKNNQRESDFIELV